MLASRFYTKQELQGRTLIKVLDSTLDEYPVYPTAKWLSEEFEGYDMLEQITLCSNISAVLDMMHAKPRGLAFMLGRDNMLFLMKLFNEMRFTLRVKLDINNFVRDEASQADGFDGADENLPF